LIEQKLENEHAIALKKVEEKLKELNGSEIEVEIKIRNNNLNPSSNGTTNNTNTNTNSSLHTSFNEDMADKTTSHGMLMGSSNHNQLLMGSNHQHQENKATACSKSTTISTAISATSSSSCSLSRSNSKPSEPMNNLSKSNSTSAEIVASPIKPNNIVVNMAKSNANKAINNNNNNTNYSTMSNMKTFGPAVSQPLTQLSNYQTLNSNGTLKKNLVTIDDEINALNTNARLNNGNYTKTLERRQIKNSEC